MMEGLGEGNALLLAKKDLRTLSATTNNALLSNAINYILGNLSARTTQAALSTFLNEVSHITNKASEHDKAAFIRFARALNDTLPGDIIVQNLSYTPLHDAAQPNTENDKDERSPLLASAKKNSKKSKFAHF